MRNGHSTPGWGSVVSLLRPGRTLAPLVPLVFAACIGTPAYQPPAIPIPPAYDVASQRARTVSSSDSGPAVVRAAAPADVGRSPRFEAAVAQGPFWREIGDTVLVALVGEAMRGSTDVQAGQARLAAARASRRLATLDLVPTVTARARRDTSSRRRNSRGSRASFRTATSTTWASTPRGRWTCLAA
jgi:outer membrane protein TolC